MAVAAPAKQHVNRNKLCTSLLIIELIASLTLLKSKDYSTYVLNDYIIIRFYQIMIYMIRFFYCIIRLP